MHDARRVRYCFLWRQVAYVIPIMYTAPKMQVHTERRCLERNYAAFQLKSSYLSVSRVAIPDFHLRHAMEQKVYVLY